MTATIAAPPLTISEADYMALIIETGSVWSDQLGFLEPTRWSPAVTA